MTNGNSRNRRDLIEVDYDQEFRFAVVLYGGVSLAIYMNGIAQELLRMVRGTAPLSKDGELRGTEKIYCQLGQLLHCGRKPGPTLDANLDNQSIRTRFVVDIISGTSAGGINGVALAKALAMKNKDLGVLKRVWLKEADLEKLLNDEDSELDSETNQRRYPRTGSTTSLLNGKRMYEIILDTLSQMNSGATDKTDGPAYADEIDLFVTATDLKGLPLPLQLTDKSIDERVHKQVFRFRFEDPNLTTKYLDNELAKRFPMQGNNGDFKNANQFSQDYDAMLAFAARCTSSFPVAFEPMRFNDIGVDRVNQFQEKYKDFFVDYASMTDPQAQSAAPSAPDRQFAFEDRQFADGGYLDNRPFSYAIDVIAYRSAQRPVQRKLLFVDPFPEISHRDTGTVGWVENARLAAMQLPRYETIRGDIERVNASNRRLNRLKCLRERLDAGVDADMGKIAERVKRSGEPENLRLKKLGELYGDAYLPYHHLRVYDVSDQLALIITKAAGYNDESDAFLLLRQILRCWRNEHFSLKEDPKKRLEYDFLTDYDVEFRKRRLNYIGNVLDEILKDKCRAPEIRRKGIYCLSADLDQLNALRENFVEKQLAQLRWLGSHLASPKAGNPLKPMIDALKTGLTAGPGGLQAVADRVLRPRDEKGRQREAEKIYYNQHKGQIDALMTALAEQYKRQFDYETQQWRNEHTDALPQAKKALIAFKEFELYDMRSFAFLSGTDSKEFAEIEIYRVSPIDTDFHPEGVSSLLSKLSGYALFDFGAFLDRRFRANDILWGRLDGAERIIAALLPDAEDEDLRKQFIEKARTEILIEEFDLAKSEMMQDWLMDRLREQMYPKEPLEKLQEKARGLLETAGLTPEKPRSDFKVDLFFQKYYRLPSSTEPRKALEMASRALRIGSDMIEGLGISASQRPLAWFRTSAWLGLRAVDFATPRSIPSVLVGYWTVLLAFAGVLLAFAGLFLATESPVVWIGSAMVAAALIVRLALQGLTSVLADKPSRGTGGEGNDSPGWFSRARSLMSGTVKFAVIIVVVVALIVGVVTIFDRFWEWAGRLQAEINQFME